MGLGQGSDLFLAYLFTAYENNLFFQLTIDIPTALATIAKSVNITISQK